MYIMWGLMLIFMSLLFLIFSLLFMFKMFIVLFEVLIVNILFMEMKFYFLFDWLNCIFISVVFFISSMVIFYSDEYMLSDKGKFKFCYLVLLFVGSMIIMLLSPNMIMILLGWDGLGLTSYCLVIYYQNEVSNSAGMITILTNRIGDVGIIMSVIFMLNFNSWNFFEYNYSMKMTMYVGFFLTMGAMTKSAQMPFSAWLPAAMAAPTPVSALVHSSTLVTAGVYLLIRLNSFFFGKEFSEVLMFVAILTMIMSGLSAMLEMDMKKIIALSTLSQLGVMMLILSISEYTLSFFHLITHALFKATLFLCAGVVIHGSMEKQDIRMMNLLWKLSPSTSMMLNLASISLMGFPFLSGFYSKDLILELMYLLNNNILLLMMIMFSLMLTVFYSLRLIYYCLIKNNFFMYIQNYYNFKSMIFPIMLMGVIVINLGSILMWVNFSCPKILSLSFEIKIFNLILLMLSIVIFIVQFKFLWKSKKNIFNSFFISLMWFLPLISSNFFFKFLIYFLSFMKENDQGWFEEVGGKNFSMLLSQNSLIYNWSQYMNMKFMLIIMLFMVLILNY